ncbi:junction-mediating and -regulatory protein-like isoform X2 [Limulus polyphemus]|uniref:Junction-mediating and -regulatory protein-like isoform X2 n=1 Tax=Limulus polyphemus TaxID=6850 RepID=A0ABM1T454_LIMPO|nr:junction-mediating and -regulatory protein-like isoform X2 [Limulus polyphemus]
MTEKTNWQLHVLKEQERNTEDPVKEIEEYLYLALDVCGKKMLFSLLFEKEDPLIEYEEYVNEFQQRVYESMVNKAFLDLKELLELREKAESLIELATVYALEDEVVTNISIALAELYNFHLKPFLELQELSFYKTTSAQFYLEDQYLEDSTKQQAVRDLEAWKNQYLSVTEAILHLYQEYYRKTVDIVSGQLNRIFEDEKKFEKSAFEIQALPRLHKLDVFVSKEKLKLISATKATREYHRDKIEQQLDKIQSHENWKEEVFRIEAAVYEAQLSVLDTRLDILQEQEQLFKKQLSILEKVWQDELDAGMFQDALEYFDQDVLEEPVVGIRTKTTKLKAKLNSVYRKRATIRNRKKACLAHLKKREKKVSAEKERSEKYHSIHMKRAQHLKEEEVKEKLKQERTKTLEILRSCIQKKLLSETGSLILGSGTSVSSNFTSDNILYRNAGEGAAAGTQYHEDIDRKLSKRSGILEDDELPLPPVDALHFPQEQQNFLFPPPPNLDVQTELDKSITLSHSFFPDLNIQTKSCSLPPSPAPPQTSLIPIFPFSSMTKEKEMDELVEKKGESLLSGVSRLDLNELLAVRSNLHKTFPSVNHATKEKQTCLSGFNWKSNDEVSKSADLSRLLHATLDRIRNMTHDSDLSNDSNSSSDFE